MMNNKFKVSDNIGQIVTNFPGASDIFLENKIDFCCGGDRPLSVAIKEQNLDETTILNLVNEKYANFLEMNEEFTDWAKEKPSKLADYVVDKHHSFLNEELPRLSELTLKILKVHGNHHPELYEVHKLFNNLRNELEGHLVKEENLVFPAIKAYENNKTIDGRQNLINLINELESEHTGAGDIIKKLQEVTDHYTTPEDGCRTFELTYRKLRALAEDTFQHIHLENNILFKNI